MKVVFNAGIYDLTHQGHANLFKKMREHGDIVVSIIHDDRSCYEIKNKIPVQDIDHRIRNINIIGLVDRIIICRSADPAAEFEQVIKEYSGHDITYMRGDDLKDFPGKWMLDKHNIHIKFIPYTTGVSSTKVRDSL